MRFLFILLFSQILFAQTSFAQITTQFQAILDESLSYSRPGWGWTSEQEFYYSLIELQPSETGLYDILNPSANLTLTNDPYVYLYENSFDPQNPTVNLIARDDDSGSGLLFRLSNMELFNSITYFMVATSYQPGATGTFDIVVSGVGSVDYGGSVENPTIPEPKSVAIIFGIFALMYLTRRRFF
jgi:hypothetical protein